MAQLSMNVAGSSKNNERSRNINSFFPYSNTYKTISSITRTGGIWCNCGGSAQSVTLSVYDQMLNNDVLIKTSNTVTCKCYGTGPSNDNYATTTFSNWTQVESNAAIAAWSSGTLIIKRFVSIKSYTSSGHGSPDFRDGYYTDTITINYGTTPFTNYKPVITTFDVFRSSNGTDEDVESESVYATIRLDMTNTTGLSDSPVLKVYYAEGEDPTTTSSSLNIASLFGITSSANIGRKKTIKLSKPSGSWDNGKDYYFLLYFSAGDEVADPHLDAAMRASVPLSIHENNCGVAIGQHSTAEEYDPKFESNWKFYPYKGIAAVDGGVYEQTLNFDTGASFTTHTGGSGFKPTLRCFGHTIELHGEIQPTKSLTDDTAYYPICTIPKQYAPVSDVMSIQQGTSQALWLLRVFNRFHSESPGKVTLARYRLGGSYANVPAGAWLPFHTMWNIDGLVAGDGTVSTAELLDSTGSNVVDSDGYQVAVVSSASTVQLSHTAAQVDLAVDRTDTLYSAYTKGTLNGVGIASIRKTDTVDLVDTYTITLTDNTTYTFTVTNGKDGVDSEDGNNGSVYMQVGDDHIQYSNDGKSWNNIIAISELKGGDGYTPIRGTDYWTEADKAEIINATLAALPMYAGEVESV